MSPYVDVGLVPASKKRLFLAVCCRALEQLSGDRSSVNDRAAASIMNRGRTCGPETRVKSRLVRRHRDAEAGQARPFGGLSRAAWGVSSRSSFAAALRGRGITIYPAKLSTFVMLRSIINLKSRNSSIDSQIIIVSWIIFAFCIQIRPRRYKLPRPRDNAVTI